LKKIEKAGRRLLTKKEKLMMRKREKKFLYSGERMPGIHESRVSEKKRGSPLVHPRKKRGSLHSKNPGCTGH